MLAVEVQGTPKERLKAFVQAKEMNYDVVEHKNGYIFIEYVTQRTKWTGSIPLLLILDQEGTVQIVQPGLIPQKYLEKIIKDLIARKTEKNKKSIAVEHHK